MMVRVVAFVCALGSALWLSNGVAADDEENVDCKDTALSLPVTFETKCRTFSQAAKQIGALAASSGNVYVEIMDAKNSNTGVYLVVINQRLTAVHLGYNPDSIKENLSAYFQDLPVSNFSASEKRRNFDVAEFVSNGDQCVAWQRYFNKSFGVYKRIVFGFGCAAFRRELVYSALEVLESPAN